MSGPTWISTRWNRFLKESALLRHYFWKYRTLVSLGLLTLLIVDGLDVLLPLILKQTVDQAVNGIEYRELVKLGGIYFGISLVQGAGRYFWRMTLVRSSMLSGQDIRNMYAKKLFRLSASFFDRNRVGDLMSLATNDTLAIRRAISAGLITLADALFYLVTIPVAMWLLSPRLTLLAFIPMLAVPFIVHTCERAIHHRFILVQESFAKLATLAQENLMGIRLVKAYAREDAQIDRMRVAGSEYIDLNLKLTRVQSAFGPSLDFIMSLGIIILLMVGGQMTFDGALSIGTFVAFQRYIQQLIWPMAALGHAVTFYQRAVASSERMETVLNHQPDITSPANPASVPDPARGEIEFRNLSFSYSTPNGKVPALKNISLKINAGERVAFLGAIGAGKSALLALLPRLYPVERGMILIDGIDINDWPLDTLRHQVGFVAQDVFLFSESISNNIAFGISTQGEKLQYQDAVFSASKLASLHPDILRLKKTYDTPLGERGLNLSGGQKQRLTIARALAMQPPILVLDDALSSVDVHTEEEILKALRHRPGRDTEIIAAHRISTIQDADRIVVLDRGEIRQIGTHSELVADRRGLYRKYFEQQTLEKELEHYAGAEAKKLDLQ